jgi:short-subunit dehydrogenase
MGNSTSAARGVAVITGASSGIGAAFAHHLAQRGYDLLLVARREEKLRELAAQLRTAHHVEVEIIATDLATDHGREFVADRLRSFSNLALLINNAGFGGKGLFYQASLQTQDEMHRLHVLTMMTLSHAALGNLLARADAQGTGIINVSSVAGFWQSPGNVSYCATKAWATSFTQGLAAELAGQTDAVKVQALCPGFTYSEFHDRLGMSRDPIPKQLWMSADFVVAESLRAFEQGKLIVVPGWRYKIIAAFMRMMPAALMLWISARASKKYRREKTAA